MNEKDNIGEHEFYTDEDVEDMLDVLDKINKPYNHTYHDNNSFYILIREMIDYINQLNIESKHQGQKINKIHHDLSRINNELINIDNSLQINNLIKLYDKEIVDEVTLIRELKKVTALFNKEK